VRVRRQSKFEQRVLSMLNLNKNAAVLAHDENASKIAEARPNYNTPSQDFIRTPYQDLIRTPYNDHSCPRPPQGSPTAPTQRACAAALRRVTHTYRMVAHARRMPVPLRTRSRFAPLREARAGAGVPWTTLEYG
jgi:hypothetical protein